MGNFGGHALPGSFFIVFALWWTVQTFRQYYRSLRKDGVPYRSTVISRCSCCCSSGLRSWPWEGAIKVFFATVGLTLEIITAFKHGKFTHLGNGQHATMFFFFGMSGMVDILMYYRMTQQQQQPMQRQGALQASALPAGLDYMMMTLAFAVEALLFRFHLAGRSSLDVLLHTLLLYSVYGCCAMCLLELARPKNPLPRLARAYFTFLQGTWFWQIGFVLYNPASGAIPWEPENHGQMMVITMMFAWHMAVVLLFMIMLGLIIGCSYHCRGQLEQTKPLLQHQRLPEVESGSDSESSL